ncbi:MAG TPA: translocation/assembly module TamB domain-containing protein [Thermoanaerobaculia bacterium]|nr:translocation/assembly module TamB domain-containing protein [Thermoanaerobaculia bacterium]
MSEPRDPEPPEGTPAAQGAPSPSAPIRRRPGRMRRWVVRPFIWGLLLMIALLAAGLLLLQSRFARQQALARLVTQASSFLGRKIQIGSLDYTFFPPGVEVSDVMVPGPRPGDPPVFRAPSARLQLTIRDLRGRAFDLEQIDVVRPQVYIKVNADGSTNLPPFNFGQGGGPRRFDVRVGRILIQDGTFQLNEVRSPFSLDARAVWGRLIGKADRNGHGGNRLDALVTAQEVATTLPHARLWRFTVSARGSILPETGRLEIATARIAGPDVTLKANGFIDYRAENRRVELHYTGEGATQILNRLGYMTDPIAGPFALAGRFDWKSDAWSYSGTARSPRVSTLGRTFEDAATSYLGGLQRIDVKIDHARYAGGSVSGLVGVEYRKETREGYPIALDLNYSGLEIRKLVADQFPGEDLPIVGGLVGRARGTLKYQFGHRAVIAGTGRADVHVEGESGGGLPIAGDLPITLDRGVISSRDLHLTSPGQEITSSGFTYDLTRSTGQLDFQLVSRDVAPLYPLLAGHPAPGEPPPFWLATQGRGTVAGTFTFAKKDYTLRLALDLHDTVAPVTQASAVHGSLTLTPRAVDDLRLELTREGGAVMVTGRVPLAPPGKTAATEPLAIAVDAVQWPAAGLGYFLGPELAGLFKGELSGRLDLTGPADRLDGRIDAQAQNLEVEGVALGKARVVASFAEGRFAVQEGQVEMPAGLAVVRGSYDSATKAFDATLTAPGLSLSAPPFGDRLGGALTGRVSVEAAASGTLDQPKAMVSIRGRDLALDGRTVGQQGDTQVVATWTGERLDVQGSLLGMASFQGGGRLDRQGADLAIDVHTENLGTLARAFSPKPLPELSGSLVGTVGLDANFASKAYRAAIRLSDLRLQYQGHTIASREPVVAEVTPERVTIRSFYLGEPGTENELFVSGGLGLQRGVPLDLRFQSTVAATWAELFVPGVKVQGSLDVLGAVRGTAGDPLLSGEGEIKNAQVIVPNLAQAFENVTGTLSFNRDHIVLDELRSRLGGGTLRATGSLSLPGPGRELAYRLDVSADDISMRFPEFLLNRGHAEVSLISNGNGGGRQIVGEIDLQRSLYVEDITVDPLVLLQRAILQRQRLQVAETDDFQSTTQLGLTVTGPDALRVRNNLANLQGDVDLAIRGTLARPVVFGKVNVDPGGTLVFNDNKYEVLRGNLSFDSATKIDPVIDLVAQTEIQGFNVTLNLGGTFEKPDVHFSSDANLADLEIVSLVATGQRPSAEAGYTPTPSPDQQAAANDVARQFLYGQAASALTKRVGTLFGFDRFRIDPLTSSGQPVSGVGVTVGKRLSKDVFVTYSYDPTNNRQSIVQVEWQLRKNVTLVLTQVGDGTYTIDAQWERRF